MPYSALIVDDSKVTRSMIRKSMVLAGIELGAVHEATNGREAIAILESTWVDIVFADLNMPVMNGLEMLDEMSRRDLIKNTPVVIVSTERSQEKIDALAAKGAQAYLIKPFTPENMKDVVTKLLGESGSSQRENSP